MMKYIVTDQINHQGYLFSGYMFRSNIHSRTLIAETSTNIQCNESNDGVLEEELQPTR
jgi:hypothetical protein